MIDHLNGHLSSNHIFTFRSSMIRSSAIHWNSPLMLDQEKGVKKWTSCQQTSRSNTQMSTRTGKSGVDVFFWPFSLWTVEIMIPRYNRIFCKVPLGMTMANFGYLTRKTGKTQNIHGFTLWRRGHIRLGSEKKNSCLRHQVTGQWWSC